jgi:hypothetical protein
MLTRRDLERPTAELTELLRERSADLLDDPDAPEPWRDLAFLFELDHQVRNGGFSQYLFNSSCVNAFDAWFATDEVDGTANEILNLALIRVGAEYAFDCDVRAMVERRAEVAPAYEKLLGVHARAHRAKGSLIEQYQAFQIRLAGPAGSVLGFTALEARFFTETDLPAVITAYVVDGPDVFVTAAH